MMDSKNFKRKGLRRRFTRKKRLLWQKNRLYGDSKQPQIEEKQQPQSSERKKQQKGKKQLSRGKKVARGIVSAILILIVAAVAAAGIYVFSIVSPLPQHDPQTIQDELKSVSTIYDDQGNVMQDIFMGDNYRMIVGYNDIPQNLINAVIAIEDKTFWTNNGFNVVRIIGAVKESLTGGGEISGTSTITQQLARNIWLTDTRSDYSLSRKIKEAWYAREITKALSKEEIITAYLNMISLGNHSYGVAAAARSYFNKDLKDLDLLECAALAALPQAPGTYSLIKTVPVGDASPTDPNLLMVTDQYMYLYNDTAEPRIRLVLQEMLNQGMITQAQFDQASSESIRDRLQPTQLQTDSISSFFTDYLVGNVAKNLYAAYPADFDNYDQALQAVYTGGYQIYSTYNQNMQEIATEEFENPANFPTAYLRKDSKGNLLDDNSNITLYRYENMFQDRDDGPWFTLKPDEFQMMPDGSMQVFAGKRLGIYNTTNADGSTEVAVEFKDFYTYPDKDMYITKGGVLIIPTQYKTMDADGNLILSAGFFSSQDDIFTQDADGNYEIGPSHFTLRQAVIQPQGAMVIIDHTNGQLKAMVGGRSIKGQMQFNRALTERQPGSTMKPIGTYGPAIEMSAEGIPVQGNSVTFVDNDGKTFGDFWTPMSIILDQQMDYNGRTWPHNWYGGFHGPQTLRTAIEQSENIPAVKVQLAVGYERSVAFLKKLGITSVVETGLNNDLNPAALALGGMTYGISPLEMASAYGTFANGGVHMDPITYTKVTDRKGNVILDGTTQSTQVMDPGAAFIINDILHTTVEHGIAYNAKVKGVPVAGKTGTSSENYDAWFVGNTPRYSAAVWIGLDLQIKMSQNSAASARMFSKIMTRIYDGQDPGEFPSQPANVVRASVGGYTDYVIDGTAPKSIYYGGRSFLICADSGMLATPWCPHTFVQNYSLLPGYNIDIAGGGTMPSVDIAPRYYCPIHDQDTSHYPTGPGDPTAPDYVAPDFSNDPNAGP